MPFGPLRATVFPLLFTTGLVVSAALAADVPKPAAGFTLPEIGAGAGSQFSASQLAFVQSWIRQLAPECPLELSAAVAQAFLEELSLTQPEKFDRLLAVDFATRPFDSLLLRHVGAKLGKPAPAAAREKIAERRVTALLTREGLPAAGVPAQIEKLRDDSAYQHRRLLEGRIEDDDLIVLLRKPGSSAEKAPAASTAKTVVPKVLTAAEIVSEFARHNQTGAAMQKLQSYIVEGRLTTATGEVEQVVFSKMRPNYVRLTVLQDGLARLFLGAEGDRFWQQVPGRPPLFAAGKDLGTRRYLSEFADPLFAGDGFEFSRLPDGTDGGKSFFRLAVRRPDGSQYVTRIEPGTYRQVGRENPDQSVARYGDFREVAGVTFAFREEITDAQGRKGMMELTRLSPNPGLIEAYFRPPQETGLDYHQVEQFLVRPSSAPLRTTSVP